MKPFTRPYERRHFKRFDMSTRDCKLTLIRRRGAECERRNSILVDLSYAGLRFQAPVSIRNGEMLEFLLCIASPVRRRGFLRGRAGWVRPLDSEQFECGVELLEESKGVVGPDEQWLSIAN